MSSVPPPTKPPRGIKSPKEKSGLLMTVIRTLSTSESNEQRDKEKAKLEREYKKSDQQLDELISVHDKDLTQVMQTFSKVSALVNNSREKIRLVKENLQACKTLLSCRRDELKKLWLEGIEHKHLLQLLEEINQLQEVPSQLASYLARKHYLHATQLLVSLDNVSLKGADGLSDLRVELHNKTQALHTKLLEELNDQLYVQSTQDVLVSRLQRQGSGGRGERRESTTVTPVQAMMKREHSSASLQSQSQGNTPNARKMLDFSGYDSKMEMSDLIEDVDQPDPEKDSDHFMAIIIECLALLNKLPEAVENLRSTMHSQLVALVDRTTQSCLSQASVTSVTQGTIAVTSSPGVTSPPGVMLLELLQVLIDQFKMAAAQHRTVLALLVKSARAHHVHISLYSLTDYWAQVQATLQQVLTAYLDVPETAGADGSTASGQPSNSASSASYSDQNNDISAYFSRRKLQRTRKSLFKFENSTYSLTKNSYLTDGLNFKYGDNQRQKNVVCPPSPQNITVIYIPLLQFVSDIEEATACGPDNPCQLNAFMYKYVKEVFVKRWSLGVGGRMEGATKCADAWKATTSTEVTAQRGLSKPLLQSTVLMDECLSETRQLMEQLPSNAGDLLQSLIGVLWQYRETCVAAYRGIVQPHPEASDRPVCSATWLNDDDISRFLKSLPNWLDLKAQKSSSFSHHHQSTQKQLKRDDTVEEESPEDVRMRNTKEAEMLASNLGESGVSSHEIIADAAQLKCLAQLQESMEWLAQRLASFTADLLQQHRGAQDGGAYPAVGSAVPRISVTNVDGIPELPEQLIKTLHQLTAAFDELANTCLLVLHLEVRVQCFYYLLPMGGGGGSGGVVLGGGVGGGVTSQDADPMVLELSRVLCTIDEAMASSLQARKSKYVFEGLGHLIAKILTSSTQLAARIDEECIRRMSRNIFILQQTLSNITLARETALDHARNYFQLFYLTPDEILNRVMEKGAEFSELEYMNAFQLIQRSRSADGTQSADSSIQRHMQRLSDILGEVGVTV
ncbi:exocyst complex component 4 [Nilaparvata lugens]|uniref:exocyst complex component 4 n=1 Tax=Nilaparvata lugens TaxID=108931 RepID=UPI00193E27F1|nr:exocyst complex component 4 [Nilaparvata lugens]